MKTWLQLPVTLLLGAAAGAGAALGVQQMRSTPAAASAPATWVDLPGMVVPISGPQGDFMGYVMVEAQLRVGSVAAAALETRKPEVLDHFNRRIWKTPLGLSGATYGVDLTRLNAELLASARAVLGPDVQAVAILSAEAA